jgi:hypothetical protein
MRYTLKELRQNRAYGYGLIDGIKIAYGSIDWHAYDNAMQKKRGYRPIAEWFKRLTPTTPELMGKYSGGIVKKWEGKAGKRKPTKQRDLQLVK